ncbi:phosphatase PAP2 family protein [Bacillus pinisoli]|uniref:phosphatase PAP2 family protein n=1 Tax=Bacillus pinisoli TaxID=2901866 RepID=UPI001FF4E50B|nr:phosphatase PAP2 family protein [Bacillus pinisoli]
MDVKLFRGIQKLSGRSTLLDVLMILISNRARYIYFFIVLFMLIKKGYGKRLTTEAFISLLISLFMNTTIKLFYYRPRPFIKRKVGILIPSKKDSSFPSKHTLLVFTVSTIILFYERTVGLVMTGLSILTGLSRIWTGHHYPSDILASAVAGSLTSYFVHHFTSQK